MKRKRPLDREAGCLRDASLIIIASEDEHAVRQYFDFFKSPKIQFRVLHTHDGRSAPEHVLARIDEYRAEFQIGDGDTFWIVCDCDRWIEPSHVKNLTHVLSECRKRNVQVALSNPCFELWLLLHFADHPDDSPLACKDVEKRLRAAVGAYNKSRVYALPLDDEKVQAAVNRAEARHKATPSIPKQTQTAVHLIIRSLIAAGILSMAPQLMSDPPAERKKPKGRRKPPASP